MKKNKKQRKEFSAHLSKIPTGIKGLDEITFGGLPRGRSTLVCGGPGCGKTLLAMEFLIRGALERNEPGVFIAFEETPEELVQNVASLGFDLNRLIAEKKIYVDHILVDPHTILETGEFDLEGLFIRIQLAVDTIGGKRVVLDTLESLFGGFTNQATLRSELQRLFRWLKEKELTTLITAERGEGSLTRQGMEEYVSDCVILLDHRVSDQISTRRLRVVKYRGSVHGTNEYPFMIDEDGISILPISSLGLDHKVLNGRISSGISGLDEMLEGKGFYRGTSILLSGTAGVGKTSFAAHFANAACARGERCLYFAFEESFEQVARNMRSIGLDLKSCLKKGFFHFVANRPSAYGLEMHLVSMHKAIEVCRPQVVVIDPVTNLFSVGTRSDITSMLIRLIDYLKTKGITAFMTSLTPSERDSIELTTTSISSTIDTWISLRDFETNGERTRGLYVLKSRGMAHSNRVRPFTITNQGILLDPRRIS